MKTLPTAHKLAAVFSSIIRHWLTTTELKAVQVANATMYADTGIDASHDYCDPNQAMLDALEQFGIEYDDSHSKLVEDAWKIAKATGFSTMTDLEFQFHLLTKGSRYDLIAWHEWNDKNGTYNDRDSLAEGGSIWTLQQLRQCLADCMSDAHCDSLEVLQRIAESL